MADQPSEAQPQPDFIFAYHRTLVRHERGTLWVMILLFALTIGAMLVVLFWIWNAQRQFAVPGIYRGHDIELRWGEHG